MGTSRSRRRADRIRSDIPMARVLADYRERSMLGLFALGETYQDVSVVYGLSRERVRQIVATAMAKIARHMGVRNGVAGSRRNGG